MSPECERSSPRQQQFMVSNGDNQRIRMMIDVLGKALAEDPSVVLDLSPCA